MSLSNNICIVKMIMCDLLIITIFEILLMTLPDNFVDNTNDYIRLYFNSKFLVVFI